MILITILMFIISLFFLILFSDLFTEHAEKIGIAFNLPPFIIGILILSIGTSLPELVSSIIASMNHQSDIILGNILGSNISNILLIVGISTIIMKKIKIFYEIEKVDLPFLFASSLLLWYILMDKKIDFLEGLFLITIFVVYLIYSFKIQNKELKNELKKQKIEKKGVIISFIIILISIIVIYTCADTLIESIVALSKELHISELFISSTALAVGTSLPELIVTISTIKRKNFEMGIGNVIGSNIFNICLILGISSMISPINANLATILFLLPFLIGITILFIISSITKEITIWEGFLYVILFMFYVYKLYMIGG